MSKAKVTKGAETLASLIYTHDNVGQVKYDLKRLAR